MSPWLTTPRRCSTPAVSACCRSSCCPSRSLRSRCGPTVVPTAAAEAYLATIEDEEQREFWRGHQATPVEFMLDVLEHLDAEHGGVEAYLRSGGMTDEQLSALRERLVA